MSTNKNDYTVACCKECQGNNRKIKDLDAALRLCDFSNCEGIHDEFCDGTSISACTTLNPPKDPMAQKHGCTYRKQGEGLLPSLM